MIINRYNYQEFFLLYTDNELSAADRRAVEEFTEQHPDLQVELDLLKNAVQLPDEDIMFHDKELLFHFEGNDNLVNQGNFEALAIAYADNELDTDSKNRLEEFVQNNPDFKKEFELLQTVKLTPDDTIVYPNKSGLYRTEQKKPAIIFTFGRIAAAAIVLLVAGFLWLKDEPASSTSPKLAQSGTTSPAKATTGKENKPDSPVLDSPAVEKEATDVVAEKEADDIATVKGKIDQPAREKKNNTTAGKKVPGSNNPDEIYNERGAASSGTETAARTPELPKSSTLRSPAETLPNNNNQTLAAIDEKIDQSNRTIPERATLNPSSTSTADYALINTAANNESDEEVFVSNIPLDRKNPLRGFIRKASRFIDKNTAIRNPKKSPLLIGNIEIAFQ